MKLTAIVLLITCLGVSAAGVSQSVTFSGKDVHLEKVFNAIKRQTGYVVFCNQKLLQNTRAVTLATNGMPLVEFLALTLKDQSLEFEISNKTILVSRKKCCVETAPSAINRIELAPVPITGIIRGAENRPLAGATIAVKGTKKATTSGADGKFTIDAEPGQTLVITYVGHLPKQVTIKELNTMEIILEEKAPEMEALVVTGIYERKKESFTGSATTYTAKDLKLVGNQNLIQSLKVLDPVFAVLQSNQFGSDPNRLPDLEIRGKSSMVGLRDEFSVDPNQPLFILDGFETTLRTIVDLDMERVASVTILKDAASTAIYGSKAANGVVVVETKQPAAGELRVSYNSNWNVSMPDFSSYNLMNSREKLQFELLAGRYNINNWDLYNERLAAVNSGVDNYWLAEPIRTGLNQKQSIYAEGGDKAMRYGIGLNYNSINGVMKNSDRDILSGNIDLIYRKKKIQFSNKLTINSTKSKDPLVAFSNYARANPYYKKVNDEGVVEKWLVNTAVDKAENPLWNDGLNSRSLGKSLGLINNFSAEYSPVNALRIRARMGINTSITETDKFVSPQNTTFETLDPLLRGTLSYTNSKSTQYEGELTSTYGMVFGGKHRLNAVAGAKLSSQEAVMNGYSAQGFSDGDYVTAAFAKGYPENGKPTYSENKNRSTSVYMNGGYSYDDRFLFDLNYRLSGSSVFGSNKRFANTWSTGVAWNLHNEAYVRDNAPWIDLLKVRASVGNPGNQNFGSYQTFTTYFFPNTQVNYFGQAIALNGLGNPDLEWQTTLDRNIGMDMSFLNKKMSVTIDYFNKLTDPLLINIGVPASLGIPTAITNLGVQESKGLNGTITYSPIYRPAQRMIWSLRYNFRTEASRFDKIGNKLDKLNELSRNKNMDRYFDGSNPDALYAVVSAGIDPATGKEIFYKKDGTYTYDFNFEDEVKVGTARPKIEGIFGSSITWKGFSANIDFRYRYGAQTFNSALFEKVENISSATILRNQDKRALYDRWQKPGDHAAFKGILLTAKTQMSSRFVEDNNSIALEAFRVGYEFNTDWLKKSGIRSLRLNAYMNDIFLISSIKTERGIDYPFARSVSFSASVSF